MSSYVTIELDTTSPIIKIYAPRYTTSEMLTTITIESNEALGDYQDIYIIDSTGKRFDLTFKKESLNKFIGNIRLNNVSIGIVNLYVRLKDEVDNLSNLMNTTIEVRANLKKATVKSGDFQKGTLNTYVKNKSILQTIEKVNYTKVYDIRGD